eukprot:COSAG06_NODE_11925_length_1446_cov_2.002970_2_plen_79_part_00
MWTYNTDAEFEEAYQAGVTGVMTDFPSRLRRFLDAKEAQGGSGGGLRALGAASSSSEGGGAGYGAVSEGGQATRRHRM